LNPPAVLIEAAMILQSSRFSVIKPDNFSAENQEFSAINSINSQFMDEIRAAFRTAHGCAASHLFSDVLSLIVRVLAPHHGSPFCKRTATSAI